MLEAFRNAAKSWFAKALMAILVMSFGLWGVARYDIFTGFFAKDLATVGGRTISGIDYNNAIRRTQQQLQQQNGTAMTFDEMRKLGIDRQVRDNLIATAAVDNEADRLKLFYSAKAIANEAAQNPAFRGTNGQFDPATFRRVLEQNGLTEDVFINSEQHGRLRNAVTDVAQLGGVPNTLLDAIHQYQTETRNVRYFVFPIDAQTAPQPTDEQIKKQYESTPAAYTAPEYRSIAVMKADPADVMSRYEISPDELKNAYDKFKSEYAVPEHRSYVQVSFPTADEAAKAKVRIDGGEDIMKIAAERNFKPTDITFSDKARDEILDPKIADAVFSTASNATSAPVAGALATAIVKVTAISPAKLPTIDELKPDLTKRLQLQKAADDIQSVYDSVEEMRSNQAKFEDIAAKLNIPLTVVPAVSAMGIDKSGKPVSLPAHDELLKAVFESDVGVEADALSIDQGYVWYEVREVIPSALRPLEEVKDQAKSDWVNANLRKLAEERAAGLAKRGNAGETLEQLASELKATIKEAKGLKRNQATPDVDGLASIAMFGVPAKGFAWSLEADGKSARIMQVTDIAVPAADPKAPDASKMADEQKMLLSRDLQDTFRGALKLASNVSINEDLWKQISGGANEPQQ